MRIPPETFLADAKSLCQSGLVFAAMAMFVTLVHKPRASADWTGRVESGPVFSTEGDVGALGIVDAGYRFGALQLGVTLGAVAVVADDEAQSTVSSPIGAQLALSIPLGDKAHLTWLGRGGALGSATNKGLSLGAFASAGVFGEWSLSEFTRVTLGVEAWFLISRVGEGVDFPLAVLLGFSWDDIT